jgi:hypothetical protein
MPEEPPQSFETHRSVDRPIYAALFAVLAAVILAAVGFVRGPSFVGGATFLLGGALILIGFRTRTYALKVQDRIIRLEMRLRLAKLLTGELAGKESDLSLSQLIGLRFASDAEVPELIRRVLSEKIARADDIKRLIKNWQADHLRV